MPGRCWERKSWVSGGRWRMRVSTLINDRKQQSTTFSISPHLNHSWKEERYIFSNYCCRIPSLIPLYCCPVPPFSSFLPSRLDSNPSSQLLLQKLLFRPWSGGWKAPTCQSQLQPGVLIPLKVWHRDMRQEPRLRLLAVGPLFLRWGNGNQCSIYCLVFTAFPHFQQIPHNQKQE